MGGAHRGILRCFLLIRKQLLLRWEPYQQRRQLAESTVAKQQRIATGEMNDNNSVVLTGSDFLISWHCKMNTICSIFSVASVVIVHSDLKEAL